MSSAENMPAISRLIGPKYPPVVVAFELVRGREFMQPEALRHLGLQSYPRAAIHLALFTEAAEGLDGGHTELQDHYAVDFLRLSAPLLGYASVIAGVRSLEDLTQSALALGAHLFIHAANSLLTDDNCLTSLMARLNSGESHAVAPLLVLHKAWFANFHAVVDSSGYYRHSEAQQKIAARQAPYVGLIGVEALLTSACLFAHDVLPGIKWRDSADPAKSRHVYVVASESLRASGVQLHVDNQAERSGTLTNAVTRIAFYFEQIPGVQYCENAETLTVGGRPTGIGHAELSQELRMLAFLREKYPGRDLERRGGFFVDVGAFEGLAGSNTLKLEMELGWKGVCLESIPAMFSLLQKRRRCLCLPLAASDKASDSVSFDWQPWNSGLSGLTETLGAGIRGMHREQRIEVQTRTLTEILDAIQAPRHIDFLSIDTEGAEELVLRGLDFSRYQFDFITLEHNYRADMRRDIRLLLEKAGYIYRAENGVDEEYYLPAPHIGS